LDKLNKASENINHIELQLEVSSFYLLITLIVFVLCRLFAVYV